MLNQPPKLSEVEKKIINARLVGLSFCQLEGNDLRVATDKILIQGAAITGAPMPSTEGFAEVLSQEIVTLINEFGFGNLTLAEIILAMRFNSVDMRFPSGVEIEKATFRGNCFSVDFLSKILYNYSVLRKFVDRKFQNKIDGYE